MKHFLYATIALLAAGSAVAALEWPVKLTPRDTLVLRQSNLNQEQQSSSKGIRKEMPAISPYILIEDFEGVSNIPPYDLPNGWTTTSTPDHTESRWLGASLATPGSEQAFPGTSGTKYAVMMGQDYSTDSWMFSPKVHMEEGKIYDIYFSVYKPQAASNTVTTFSVHIGDTPDIDSMELELMTEGRSMNNWNIYNRPFTPDQTGDYYIGFHAEAGDRSYLTAVDDVMVAEACPRIYAPADLIFPEKTSFEDEAVAVMDLFNLGSGSLELKVGECSPELEIVDIPHYAAARRGFSISVRLTSKTSGDYEGFVTLLTNDPLNPEVKVICRGKVTEGVKTSYWFEDFEKATPAGWDLTDFYYHPYKGVNGSRCLENWTLYTSDIISHYIDMGENPVVGFSYKAQQYDISGTNSMMPPTKPEYVKINVYLSDDFGRTFQRVYRIAPEDGDISHVLSYDYADVRIPLPDYKNKVCQVKIEVEKSKYFGTDDYGILIDNIEIGTCKNKDLSAISLFGSGLIKVGHKATYSFQIHNAGNEAIDASEYSVDLQDENGNNLASADGVTLAKGQNGTVTLEWTPKTAGSHCIHAVIDFIGDEDLTNNTTAPRQIGIFDTESVVTVPTEQHNSGYSIQTPVNYYYKNCAVQTLYYANDIKASEGILQGIRFAIKNDADFISPSIDVWIGETDRMNFNDGSFVDPNTLTKVYSGAMDIPAGVGAFDIPFTENYKWGGKNLVVYIVKNSTNFYHYKMFAATKENRLDGCTIGVFSDTEPIDAMNPGKGEPNNEVAIADFYWVKDSNKGNIEGTVSDEMGPVENAKVLLEGTSYFSVTDAAGHYCFSDVAAGEHSLTVEAYGHDMLIGESVIVEKSAILSKDMQIAIASRHAVSFKVTDTAGNPLARISGRLIGYSNYSALSDAEGILTFPEVFDREEKYEFAIEQNGYQPYYSTIRVTNDVKEDITLRELLNAPSALEAIEDNGKINLSWVAPQDEFGYDNGICVDKLGFDTGNKTSLIGVAFNNDAVLEEISWFTNNTNNPHSTVNVYVLALDENGRPTANILFGVEGAPNIDGEWSSFTLPKAVEAPNGFYVGISCDGGFLGLGVGELRSEKGLRAGQFWTSSEFTFQAQPDTEVQDGLWVDNYGTANGNYVPMIRVKGVDNGYIDRTDYTPVVINWYKRSNAKADFARNIPTYNIKINGKLVAQGLESTTYSIDNPGEGEHIVAVAAVYPSGESEPIETTFVASAVGEVNIDNIKVTLNLALSLIEIKGWEDIEQLSLLATDGSILMTTQLAGPSISIPFLNPGVYIAVATLKNGKTISVKLIR